MGSCFCCSPLYVAQPNEIKQEKIRDCVPTTKNVKRESLLEGGVEELGYRRRCAAWRHTKLRTPYTQTYRKLEARVAAASRATYSIRKPEMSFLFFMVAMLHHSGPCGERACPDRSQLHY